MSSFLDRILGREKSSAKQAKERLKLVIISDRTDISPGTVETLKDELIEGVAVGTMEMCVEIVKKSDKQLFF